MGRLIRNTDGLSDDASVEPRAYDPDGFGDEDAGIRDWRASLGYQRGDVIWVQRGDRAVKAQVLNIIPEQNRWGGRRPLFRVRYQTAKGAWSRVWINTWPGFIERGYQLAAG